METKNLIIISLISVLFIGAIFFSGCSEDIQKYVDMGKDKLDDITSKKSGCEKFCDSKGYQVGECIDSVKESPSEYECLGNACNYGLETFDIGSKNISCEKETEDTCICYKEEDCGSTEEECKIGCSKKGCSIPCEDHCILQGYDVGFCVEPDQLDNSVCEVYDSDVYCEYDFKNIDTNIKDTISCERDNSYCRCGYFAICGRDISSCEGICGSSGCTAESQISLLSEEYSNTVLEVEIENTGNRVIGIKPSEVMMKLEEGGGSAVCATDSLDSSKYNCISGCSGELLLDEKTTFEIELSCDNLDSENTYYYELKFLKGAGVTGSFDY